METTEQSAVMRAEPQREHEWLRRLVGDWTYEAVAQAPGQPVERATGTESVRSIGDIWFVAEAQGEMPGGGAATSLMTLGYDPAKGRYIGSWIGSMMHHMWVYDGQLDDSRQVLTLDTEGPDFGNPGKLARYRDVLEFRSTDHRVLTSHAVGADGEWHAFMTSHYRRRK